MRIGTFSRQRLRIERRFPPGRKRTKALAHLARDARAAPVLVHGGLVGWQFPHGGLACVKRRYGTQDAALSDIGRMRDENPTKRLPHRAYACGYCGGWHATSQTKVHTDPSGPQLHP